MLAIQRQICPHLHYTRLMRNLPPLLLTGTFSAHASAYGSHSCWANVMASLEGDHFQVSNGHWTQCRANAQEVQWEISVFDDDFLFC